MERGFIKMHGCGNDYIYFDCLKQPLAHPEEVSVLLSDRHKGIGGDGIVLICPSEVADAKMRMFNIDGSEGKMCGNAIRCVGKYLYDNGLIKTPAARIETLSGIKTLQLTTEGNKAVAACVDMGPAELNAAKIPVIYEKETVINQPLTVDGTTYQITCVSMGNPHCVVFCEEIESLPLCELGPKFEFHPMFPERVNTEFIQVIGPRALNMRVWERGSGETMACGTGACAAVAAAVENGFSPKGEDVVVHLLGGELTIRYTDQAVYMTGNAEVAFTGCVQLPSGKEVYHEG